MLSPIDKLHKFIKLEKERGYDNRAVVGGLDKILPAWESEARASQIEPSLIDIVIATLRDYPNLEPDQRAEALDRLLDSGDPEPAQESTSSLAEQEAEPQAHEIVPAAAIARASARPRGDGARTYPSDPTGLHAPLRVLQGVGPKMSETLAGLGLYTLEDLLYFFPRRYDDYSQLKPINRLEIGEDTTVLGAIQSIFSRPIRGGKLQLTEAVVSDGTGALRVTWFNQTWLTNRFTTGTQVVLAGKIEQYMGRLSMSNPEIEAVEQEHLHTNRIVPVYPLTAKLTQRMMRRMLFQTVSYWAPRTNDYLPQHIRSAVKLVDLPTALMNVHFPETQDQLDVARWRLAFDEIFLLQMGVLKQKRTWQAVTAQVFETSEEWLQAQIQRLPYALTSAQTRVLQEIRAELASGRPLDRLVQGDVGSGKTVVAALALAMVARHGAQSAVMAPTSILAEQHYRTLRRVLAETQDDNPAPLAPHEIRLLIGDTSETDKAEIRAGLADSSIKIIVGTHALIESPVQFQRLQLAVIDEQHRFGVAQRALLRSKGENPHLLVMTATPIPRSLALTLYGDLDISVMDEMPPGRQPVSTHVLRPVERERAYRLIHAQIEKGNQAFIIYPLVEAGEEEGGNKTSTLAAVEEQARLQKHIFPKRKVGLLHGRMKPEEKDQVMRAFRDKEYDVLVSTTVVEVGVDIPNATVMLIEGANRFGLAQLHQLRGRVGRGSEKAYCLLIPDHEDAVENERLAVMAETTDGFVLAERDLQQRGPGEFLGTRQAGFTALRMANLTDVRLIERARQQAQALFASDPDLSAPEYAELAQKVEQFWGGGKGDIS